MCDLPGRGRAEAFLDPWCALDGGRRIFDHSTWANVQIIRTLLPRRKKGGDSRKHGRASFVAPPASPPLNPFFGHQFGHAHPPFFIPPFITRTHANMSHALQNSLSCYFGHIAGRCALCSYIRGNELLEFCNLSRSHCKKNEYLILVFYYFSNKFIPFTKPCYTFHYVVSEKKNTLKIRFCCSEHEIP